MKWKGDQRLRSSNRKGNNMKPTVNHYTHELVSNWYCKPCTLPKSANFWRKHVWSCLFSVWISARWAHFQTSTWKEKIYIYFCLLYYQYVEWIHSSQSKRNFDMEQCTGSSYFSSCLHSNMRTCCTWPRDFFYSLPALPSLLTLLHVLLGWIWRFSFYFRIW